MKQYGLMEKVDSVLMLEFNELSPTLMQRFIGEGKLPNFKRLYEQSQVFTTEAEERAPFLEPWIQWVTVHCGLPYREHNIETLDEGHKLKVKSLWDLMSDAGRKVWICGSMNVFYSRPMNGFILPDPWSTTIDPYPDLFRPYFRFVHENVLEYATKKVPLSALDHARFIAFMVQHGLTFSTARTIVEQLATERFKTRRASWKRATILDRLQFDVFRHIYKRERPQFATFFLNSTAHFQHLYWRNFQPQLFKVQPSAEEQVQHENAILYGYQEMDRIVGEAEELCDGRTALVFCTALSQQPCLTYEDRGGKKIYRPRDFEKLLAFAGVTEPHRVVPVMSQEFRLYLDTEAEAISAAKKLEALHLFDERMLNVERKGNEILAGSCVIRDVADDVELWIKDASPRTRFYDIFTQLEGLKSGMHHPDGIFTVRLPSRRGKIHDEKVPLVSVAPTLLSLLDVSVPDYMTGAPLFVKRAESRAAS